MNMKANTFRGMGRQMDLLNTLQGGSAQSTLHVEKGNDHLLMKLTAPSVSADKFNVLVEGNKLVIYTLLISSETESGGERVAVPMFMRVVDIPDFVEADLIEATYQPGRLLIHLPFKDKAQMHRRINIKNDQ